QNTYTVDGADVTDRGSNITIQAYPSVDSIAEFKVQRSLFSAESGRSGGGQINIVTRGGGDQFHGSIFEFVRNERLNANDFISNRISNPAFGRDSNGKAKRAPFRYNNFGGTFGGPIYLPRFGEGGPATKKIARTYFFFSEEQRRDLRYPTLSGTVPDLNSRQGIFPIDICLSANAPTTATATCTNILPAGTPFSSKATVNPVAQQYLSLIYNKLPAPTDAVTRALVFPAQNIANFRQEIIRIDHGFSSKLSVYYRYEHDKIPTVDVNSLFSSGAGLPGVSTSATDSPGRTHTAQVTYVATPSFVVIGRWTYGYGAILSNTTGSMAVKNSPITPPLAYTRTRDFVPTVSGNGYSTLTTFGDYNNFSYKHNFGGDATWTRGTHTIKFGGTYSYYRKNENALSGNNAGGFSGFLNTVPTSVVQANVLAPNFTTQRTALGLTSAQATSLQSFANFLLGTNVAFTQSRFDYTADLRQFTIESYAQDEWRMRRNLTLYYGVRHSYFSSPYDTFGRLSNFDPKLWSAAQAPQVAGTGNRVAGTGNFCNGMFVNSQNFATAANNCTPIASPYGKYIVKAPKGDFAPRIGIAWDPFGKGTTSVRMGYGIYYDQILNGWYEQMIGQNPPYQETFTVSNGGSGSVATTPRLDQPVPTGIPVVAGASLTALSIRSIQPQWKDPYMQHWSLEVQRLFGSKTVVSAGYFGSKGTHLIGAFELNEIQPGVALNSQCVANGSASTLQTPGVTTVPCQVAGTYFGGSSGGVSSNILDQIRPFRGYRSITVLSPQFNSNYHSLQTLFQRRFAGASQVNVAYTWSKNLTDNISDRSDAPSNSYNIRLDRGRATLDRTHVFTANYIYEIPFFSKRHDFVGNALGGWEISGVATLQSGLWYTVTTNFDAAGLGNIPAAIAGNRANVLCDPNTGGAHTFEAWFNTSCYEKTPTAAPVANVVGNGPRGGLLGPPTKRFDFSLFKNIRIGEKVKFQIRAEAFNVFNHTNFRNLSSTSKISVTSGTFGQINAVRDPRTIQFGGKLSF
ncbi:MAG TPA: TonB-dependent receptor, partial [Pyrinomonadaceae bacterium]|nr:TonB-dependent receptor [Pyrinomonadaceae bacterium]